MPRVFRVVALLLAAPVVARPQARPWEFGASAGGGPSVVTASWGGVADRELLITTVYAARPLILWKGFSVSWVGEVLPVVVATKVPKAVGSWFPNRLHNDSIYAVFPYGSGPDLGVGATPVGLRLGLRLSHNVAIFAEGNAGAVAFARAMPEVNARSANFLGGTGAGLRFGQRDHRSFIVGYRFAHISNANTALENPGFNAHLFYVGLTLH